MIKSDRNCYVNIQLQEPPQWKYVLDPLLKNKNMKNIGCKRSTWISFEEILAETIMKIEKYMINSLKMDQWKILAKFQRNKQIYKKKKKS